MSSSPSKVTKKQLNADALTATLESRWEDAISINDEILNRFPRDAEALNRKGRALMELGRLTDARDAFTDALKADAANMIARRNLQRLETLHTRGETTVQDRTQSIPRPAVFVEEIGKTWMDELAHPAEMTVLAEVAPGDELELKVEGDRILVLSVSGAELGQIDQMVGSRMAKLVEAGYEFNAYALGTSANSLRVIIRETVRPDDSANVMTFPRQDFASQDLMREREQLFQREEGDFDFGDDDDDADQDEEDSDEDEDLDNNDEENGSYVGDSVVDDEETPEE